MLKRSGSKCTETNLRKNLRLRTVIRPDPFTRTTCWSNWRTSTTLPVLSHLVGWRPIWISHVVTRSERRESFRMLRPSFSGPHMSITQCFFAGRQGIFPGVVWCGVYLLGRIEMKSLIGRQIFRNSWVRDEVNSGPPSVESSSGMPKVPNVRRRQSMRPFAPSWALSMMGQFEERSTITR